METKTAYFRNERLMAQRAVRLLRREYARAVRANGRFSVVLSGGRTPAAFFSALAAQRGLDWKKIFFFFADERVVPRAGKDSNFRAAKRLLFSKAAVPQANIFGIPAALGGARGAKAYEKALTGFFGGRPAFDLVFLGLGAEGHTASLFPDSPALRAAKRLAVAATAPAYARPRPRITLTLKALNSARAAVFLVAGPEKKEIFARLAAGKKNLPASRVRPAGVRYLFYAAA